MNERRRSSTKPDPPDGGQIARLPLTPLFQPRLVVPTCQRCLHLPLPLSCLHHRNSPASRPRMRIAPAPQEALDYAEWGLAVVRACSLPAHTTRLNLTERTQPRPPTGTGARASSPRGPGGDGGLEGTPVGRASERYLLGK